MMTTDLVPALRDTMAAIAPQADLKPNTISVGLAWLLHEKGLVSRQKKPKKDSRKKGPAEYVWSLK